MANFRIPNIVKHCCVAIYREGKISAKTKKDLFLQCFKIAKARLTQYGFIVVTGDSPTASIGLTPKGRAAELRHKREGRAKTLLFDTLYDGFDLDGTKAAEAKKQQEAAAAVLASKMTPAKTATATKKKK